MSVLIDGEVVLYGFCGDSYWDAGFTDVEVLEALAELGRDADFTCRINSGGGYTNHGIAIYNAFSAHKGKITVIIDAMAASAASVIAMAGDERIMRKGALMMIHDPAAITFGTVDDHRKSIELLDRLGDQMAGIYADITGESTEEMRSAMKDELWLDPDEAVKRGFATSAEKAKSETVSAFDYRLYAHAPRKLKTLAADKSWSFRAQRPKAAASATVTKGHKGANPMSEQSAADDRAAEITTASSKAATDAVAADRKRRKDILALDEAKGREALAEQLHATTMSVEDVKSALAAAPKASEPAPKSETDKPNPAAYEQGRTQASGLTAPGGTQQSPTSRARGPINRGELYASRAKAAKEA